MPVAWPLQPRRVSGTVTGVSSAAYTTVTLPAGLFSVAPTVIVNVVSPASAAYPFLGTITATSFQVATSTATTQTIAWTAFTL